MGEKRYVCIDLKSFFASCECAERGLDPFKVNLVVADPDRSVNTVCLAITPAMKELGIRNRCRIREIPKNVEYIVAKPRMRLYMRKSAEIYSVYLNYISPDDIHVYSVDECFIDVTDYMKLYGKTEFELAKFLTEEVYKKTKIRATVGIGTNLFLAKVALDVTAKKSPDFMGFLDEDKFKKEMWHHTPITDVWNVGIGTAKRLAKYGVHDLYGVAHFDEGILYKEFGVNAELLIDHAWGKEPCTIADIKKYRTRSASLSVSQILFRDYKRDNAFTVLKEMLDGLVLELIDKELVAGGVSLYVGYSRDEEGSAGGTMRLSGYTDSYRKLLEVFKKMYYERTADKPIRRLGLGLTDLEDNSFRTVDFFTDEKTEGKERDISETVIGIKKKFGKNAIVKGTSFEEGATGIERNKMVGGHNGGEDSDW